jgi:hypothetical protein
MTTYTIIGSEKFVETHKDLDRAIELAYWMHLDSFVICDRNGDMVYEEFPEFG